MFGTRRLWCDETINWVDGIDDRHVAIRGHRNAFVYDHTTGELVTGIDPASIPSGTAPLHPRLRADPRWSKVSPDGKWAAIGSLGPRLRVYDNTTGEMKFAEDPPSAFDHLTFSPDGARIAALANGAWVFGDTTQHVPGITYGLAFCGDDLVGGTVGKLARWSLDGTERTRVSIRHKIEHLSFTDDGTHAAVTTLLTSGLCAASMPDVVVADLARGTAILRFHDPNDDLNRSASLSPDGRWLVLSDGESTRLCSAAPRAPWSKPPVLAEWPGCYLAPGWHDRALRFDGDVALIELPTGTPLGPRFPSEGVVSWGRDYLYELALDRQHLRIRDPVTFEVTGERALGMVVEAMAVSRDGKRLAITDGPIIQLLEISPH